MIRILCGLFVLAALGHLQAQIVLGNRYTCIDATTSASLGTVLCSKMTGANDNDTYQLKGQPGTLTVRLDAGGPFNSVTTEHLDETSTAPIAFINALSLVGLNSISEDNITSGIHYRTGGSHSFVSSSSFLRKTGTVASGMTLKCDSDIVIGNFPYGKTTQHLQITAHIDNDLTLDKLLLHATDNTHTSALLFEHEKP